MSHILDIVDIAGLIAAIFIVGIAIKQRRDLWK